MIPDMLDANSTHTGIVYNHLTCTTHQYYSYAPNVCKLCTSCIYTMYPMYECYVPHVYMLCIQCKYVTNQANGQPEQWIIL